MFRHANGTFEDGNETFPYLPEGFLLALDAPAELESWRKRWDRARADTFAASEIPQGRFA